MTRIAATRSLPYCGFTRVSLVLTIVAIHRRPMAECVYCRWRSGSNHVSTVSGCRLTHAGHTQTSSASLQTTHLGYLKHHVRVEKAEPFERITRRPRFFGVLSSALVQLRAFVEIAQVLIHPTRWAIFRLIFSLQISYRTCRKLWVLYVTSHSTVDNHPPLMQRLYFYKIPGMS